MNLPEHVIDLVAGLLEKVPVTELQEAHASLSHVYRKDRDQLKHFTLTQTQTLSYLATRLPATYSVCTTVLQILQTIGFIPQNVLDIGAGPGTASLACCALFPSVSRVLLQDREPFFREIALQILASYACQCDYKLTNFTAVEKFEPSDFVICSYALGEIPQEKHAFPLDAMWHATQKALVLIEPGTPLGFSTIKEARAHLIQREGKIVAPCTHENACPMTDNDWCHFSARVERCSFHKTIKKGTLGYEDEKYAYLVILKGPPLRPVKRIIRHPLQRSGHVTLDTCGPEGLSRTVVSKRDKTLYKKARKCQWGDGWDGQQEDVL